MEATGLEGVNHDSAHAINNSSGTLSRGCKKAGDRCCRKPQLCENRMTEPFHGSFSAVYLIDFNSLKESQKIFTRVLDTLQGSNLYTQPLRDTGASAPMPLCEIQRRDRLNQPGTLKKGIR
jgi:hypothetical protein